MSPRDFEIAKKLKNRLLEHIPLIDLRVFGSRARGDNQDESDMDVFVETSVVDKKIKEKIWDVSWEIGFENFMVISALVFSREEIESSPLRSAPIIKNIFSEGIRI